MPTEHDVLVDVRGLEKSFGRRTVMTGLTMQLTAGMLIGLVGANGGGKTTSLRILAGLMLPSAGSGTVLGADVRKARRPGSAIGYMGQSIGLYPELTVRDNLRFRIDCHGLPHPSRALAEIADRFGVEPVLDRRVAQLSGGWARRAQFAAATMHRPRLLLLDEPTAGLDVVTRQWLWQWLGDFIDAGGAAVIATHDLVEAERCPIVIHYADGRAALPEVPRSLMGRAGTDTLEAAIARLALAS